MNFRNEAPLASTTKQCQDPLHSWWIFLQPHAVCTSHIHCTTLTYFYYCIYAVAFKSYSRHIYQLSIKQQHPRSSIHTSSQSSSCTYNCCTWKTWCERSQRTHQMASWWRSSLRFETVAVTCATLCTSERLQLNKMPGHNCLCGPARRVKSLQRSRWVFHW